MGWLLIGLSAVNAHAREGRLELGPAYDEITTQVETPHLKWARPLAGGPIKVLAVATRNCQRETVELWQRMDMRYTAIATSAVKELGHPPDDLNYPAGGSQPAVETRLRQAMLGDYDVIVIGVAWSILPEDVASAIAEKVRKGAGLVLASPGELAKDGPGDSLQSFIDTWKPVVRPNWVLAGSRLDELPGYRKGEKDKEGPPERVFDCFTVDEGRVAKLKCSGFLMPDIRGVAKEGRWEYEDEAAFVAKLLYWAAGRAPSVHLTQFALTEDGSALRLTASGGAGHRVSARITLRDAWGQVVTQTTGGWVYTARTPSHDLPLSPLPLKGGSHRAEVHLFNYDSTVAWWGTWQVDVKPKFGIAQVTLDSDEVQPGQAATGHVELAGEVVQGAKLVFRVTDAHGRLVCETEQPAKTGPFSVKDAHPRAIYHDVAVVLMSEGKALDEKHVRFAVPLKGPGWDDFSFVMWHHTLGNWKSQLISRELREHAEVDAANCAAWLGPEDVENVIWSVAEHGLWATPYVCHTANYWGGTNLNRAPCLSHPDYIRETVDRMREIGRRLRKFCPPGYDLGDENVLTANEVDVCFSPDCQASLRTYLQQKYVTLEALNAKWGTAFTDWSEVSPITKAEALEKGQIARWVDHRTHMNKVFADTHRRWRNAIRESDAQARVGFEGPVGRLGYNGYDLGQFAQFMDFWGAYPYAQDWYDAPRSFVGKNRYTGVWFGGYPDTRYWFHNWPWKAALSGMNSAWWWPDYGCNACDALTPDLRLYPDFQQTVERDIRPLKTGLGKLILHAQTDPEPVAVLYSMPSVYAGLAYGQPFATLRASQLAAEAGLTYRLITPQQIAAGQLSAFKVLVLPASLALSDAEASAIRQFVEAGGMLIADQRPGITDEHGKLRAVGALDALLGIQQNMPPATQPAEPCDLSTTDGLLAKAKNLQVDDAISLSPDAGEVQAFHAGATPYFIVRDVGKGRTVFLNAATPSSGGIGAALTPLLRARGLQPAVTITDAKGNVVEQPTLYRFGDAMLVAFNGAAQRNAWGDVDIHWPTPVWTYVARENLGLGHGERPRVAVNETARYRVVVGLPYQPTGLAVQRKADASPRASRFDFTLETKNGKPGYHVLRITVADPVGREHDCYAANLDLNDGRGRYVVPLAINDLHGQWTLTAVDVISGVRAQITWND
ncbi:MAG: beta-galactosidase trimerization domain-containing protein [Phycisphaeraceae bacterium]|nr:beta-galactosidase trimerization domain-containing protein [Phycisphaeraceae bacterium]